MTVRENEKRTYITFYRVMLILSTIGTSVAVLGILSTTNTLALHGIAPLFVTCAILLNVVAVVNIVALVLLWQKNPLGISLKISAYIVSIVVTAIGLTGAQPYISHVTEKTTEQVKSQSPAVAQQVINLIPEVVTYMVYTALTLSIIGSVVFALLWQRAWKKQRLADERPDQDRHTKKSS